MFTGHPLLWLALLTFLIVAAFAVWQLVSTRRRQRHGPDVPGPGNRADPAVGEEADTGTPYMQQANRKSPAAPVRSAPQAR